jgi:FixJ family two-component response regulator
MKAAASDFIENPIGAPDSLASIRRALEQVRDVSKLVAWRESATQHIADLTPRQREIMDLVPAGWPPQQEDLHRPWHQPTRTRAIKVNHRGATLNL